MALREIYKFYDVILIKSQERKVILKILLRDLY